MPAYKGAVNTGRKKKEKTFFFLENQATKTYALCGPLLFIIVYTFQPIIPTANFFFSTVLYGHHKNILLMFFIRNTPSISLQKAPKKYRVSQIMQAIYAYNRMQRCCKY